MKHLFKYFFFASIALGIVSCEDANNIPNGYIETTQADAKTFVMEGYQDARIGYTVLTPAGAPAPFYIKNRQFAGSIYLFSEQGEGTLESMGDKPADNVQWEAMADIKAGSRYWARFGDFATITYLKLRVAYVEGNNVGIEYVKTVTENRPNANSNQAFAAAHPEATRLEMPALNADNQFVAYWADQSDDNNTQIFNYALEYVAARKHSTWVAFNFDAVNSLNPTKRSNAWEQDDPNIDNDVEPTEAMHKSDGYDKGHLVASADRAFSNVSNKQTFYYANISPQIGNFNQGFWQELEAQVQKWGRSTQQGTLDTLYVTKGGTLNKLLTNFTGTIKANDGKYPTTDADGLTPKGLPVPAYYYMALLSVKDGQYHAIGFYVQHSELLPKNPTMDDFMVYAVSIDKLEEETGLDFFCNLPDDLEESVESAYDKANWN